MASTRRPSPYTRSSDPSSNIPPASSHSTSLSLTVRHIPSDRWQHFTVPAEQRISQLKHDALAAFSEASEPVEAEDERGRTKEMRREQGGDDSNKDKDGDGEGQKRVRRKRSLVRKALTRRKSRENIARTSADEEDKLAKVALKPIKHVAEKLASVVTSKVKLPPSIPLRAPKPKHPSLPSTASSSSSIALQSPSIKSASALSPAPSTTSTSTTETATTGSSRDSATASLLKHFRISPRSSRGSSRRSSAAAPEPGSSTASGEAGGGATPSLPPLPPPAIGPADSSESVRASWPPAIRSPGPSRLDDSAREGEEGLERSKSLKEKAGLGRRISRKREEMAVEEERKAVKEEDWCLVNAVLGCRALDHHIVGAKFVDQDLLLLKPRLLDYDPPLERLHLPFIRFPCTILASSLKTASIDLARPSPAAGLAPPSPPSSRRPSIGRSGSTRFEEREKDKPFVERVVEVGVDDGTWETAMGDAVPPEQGLTMVVRVYKAGRLQQIYPLPADTVQLHAPGSVPSTSVSGSTSATPVGAPSSAAPARSTVASNFKPGSVPLVQLDFGQFGEHLSLQPHHVKDFERLLVLVGEDDDASDEVYCAELEWRKAIIDRAFASRHKMPLPPLPTLPPLSPSSASPTTAKPSPITASSASPPSIPSTTPEANPNARIRPVRPPFGRRQTTESDTPNPTVLVPRSKSSAGLAALAPPPPTLRSVLTAPSSRRPPPRGPRTSRSAGPGSSSDWSGASSTCSNSPVSHSPIRVPLARSIKPVLTPLASSSSSSGNVTPSSPGESSPPASVRFATPAVERDPPTFDLPVGAFLPAAGRPSFLRAASTSSRPSPPPALPLPKRVHLPYPELTASYARGYTHDHPFLHSQAYPLSPEPPSATSASSTPSTAQRTRPRVLLASPSSSAGAVEADSGLTTPSGATPPSDSPSSGESPDSPGSPEIGSDGALVGSASVSSGKTARLSRFGSADGQSATARPGTDSTGAGSSAVTERGGSPPLARSVLLGRALSSLGSSEATPRAPGTPAGGSADPLLRHGMAARSQPAAMARSKSNLDVGGSTPRKLGRTRSSLDLARAQRDGHSGANQSTASSSTQDQQTPLASPTPTRARHSHRRTRSSSSHPYTYSAHHLLPPVPPSPSTEFSEAQEGPTQRQVQEERAVKREEKREAEGKRVREWEREVRQLASFETEGGEKKA
ncbi:hypothetical protein JCM8097_002030 [Rhodosporidiobolus ruineniae]